MRTPLLLHKVHAADTDRGDGVRIEQRRCGVKVGALFDDNEAFDAAHTRGDHTHLLVWRVVQKDQQREESRAPAEAARGLLLVVDDWSIDATFSTGGFVLRLVLTLRLLG